MLLSRSCNVVKSKFNRTGAVAERLRSQRPRLPVTLPLSPESPEPTNVSTQEARSQLGIDPDHAVVIWLDAFLYLPKLILGLRMSFWSVSPVNSNVPWSLLSVVQTTNHLLIRNLRVYVTLSIREFIRLGVTSPFQKS